METVNLLNITQRVKAPTPPFFKKLRTIGLVLVATCTALLAAPIALPALVTKVAGYILAAGSMLSAVSQTTVEDNAKYQEEVYE